MFVEVLPRTGSRQMKEPMLSLPQVARPASVGQPDPRFMLVPEGVADSGAGSWRPGGESPAGKFRFEFQPGGSRSFQHGLWFFPKASVSRIPALLTVETQASRLSSCFSFLVCKMGIIIIPPRVVVVERK